MKKVLLLTLFVALFSCKNDDKKEVNKEIAQEVESKIENNIDFEVIDYYGLEKILKRDDDKTYVVNFWATWCAPCVKELPYFEKLDKEYEDKNVEVVLVSLDFPKKYESQLRPFINKYQLRSELYALDDHNSNFWIPKVEESWSGAIPATLIYNKEKRKFYEKSFDYIELETEIYKFIKN